MCRLFPAIFDIHNGTLYERACRDVERSRFVRSPVSTFELKRSRSWTTGDGVGGLEDITFHRITLSDQGTFGDMAIASANYRALVFADELIGTTHYQVGVEARLNEYATTPAHAQVTFSGYLEDLPSIK